MILKPIYNTLCNNNEYNQKSNPKKQVLREKGKRERVFQEDKCTNKTVKRLI